MSERGHNFARLFNHVSVKPPLITDCEKPSGPSRQLNEWRTELVDSRGNIIGKPGAYLDRSATGLGKSTADIEAVQKVDAALIVVPTHENAEEVETDMQAAEVNAMKFPGLIFDGENINCLNGAAAERAQGMGLSVVSAVCPSCNFLLGCRKSGYRAELEAVHLVDVAIATAQRAVYNGLNKLATGRHEYVVIHEDAAGTMCPDAVASLGDLNAANEVLTMILTDPKYLDWLGQSASKDENGEWVENEKLAERRERIDEFIRHLDIVVVSLIECLKTATQTQAVEVAKPIKKATGTDNLLLRASLESEAKFTGGPWRLLLAAASGELHSIGVIVDDSPNNSKQASDSPKRRTLVGTWRNTPGENAVVLFCDATADKDDLEAYLGRPVIDITPAGHVQRSKRVVQFPKDITRRTKANPFLAIIRGILSLIPGANKVGVITHRTLVGHLSKIGEPFASRIAMSTYFGSGADRASNDWYSQCDLIVVAGTPRVASMAVQRRLVQRGDFAPAGENPDWGEILWRGHTESGAELIVKNRGYRHPLWNRAHRSLVRAAIIQAAGRGRSLLESGCEVVIVSTEECGFSLADESGPMVADADLRLLESVRNLTAEKVTSENLSAVYVYSISKTTPPLASDVVSFPPLAIPASTPDIATSIGLSDRRARELLTGLESRKLVTRSGDRGGWLLTDSGRSLLSIGQANKGGGQSL